MEERTNPYLGPNTFGYEHRHLFFGREREANELFSKVISERLVLFYAQSGAGKSSLLNARLRPRLEEAGFYVLPVGRVSGEPPPEAGEVDNIFLFNLMFGLVEGKGDPARLAHLTLTDFLARLVSEDGVDYAYDETAAAQAAALAVEAGASSDRYVLIIDQFEEILTRHLDRWPEREEFFQQLNEAMKRDPNLWVVLALREDYVAGLSPYASLMNNRMRGRYYMQRMAAAGALEAIRRPAKLQPYNRPFAPGVAEQLVDNLCLVHMLDMQGNDSLVPGESVEPLELQVVCYELWENLAASPGEAITGEDLSGLAARRGSAAETDLAHFVDRVLADYYEAGIRQVVADPSFSVSEGQVREWFRENLITESGTRGMVVLGKEETGDRIRLPNKAVQRLEAHRLLRTETRAGAAWCELVHDRFIEPILSSNHAYLLRRVRESPLVKAAHDWADTGRPQAKLWVDQQLKEALQTASDQDREDPIVAAFLDESQKVQRERDLAVVRGRARFWLKVGIAGGVLALLALAFAVFGVLNWRQADLNAADARNQQGTAVAERARADKEAKDARAAQATLEVESARADKEAKDARAARASLEAENRRYNALELAEAARRNLDVDRDLSLLLAVHAVRLHLDAREPIPIEAEDALQQAVLNPPSEAAIVLGRAERTRELVLTVDGTVVYDVDWSPDGATLVTAGEGDSAILWDAVTGQELFRLPGHEGPIIGVAFSPDGQRLATASIDGTALVWDLDRDELSLRLQGDGLGFYDVAWSPDGATLATVGEEGTAVLWDAFTGEQLRRLSGHEAETFAVAFSPDGQRLATASFDGTSRVWDAATGEELRVLVGHEGEVFAVAFSPDGQRLATAGLDGTSQVWDASSGQLLLTLAGNGQGFYDVAWSPDGATLVTVGEEGAAVLWDAFTGEQLRRLSGHESEVIGVAFSRDGQRLATASTDGTVRIWDLQEEVSARAFLDFDAGNHLLRASEDGVLTVWDISSNEQAQPITATGQISVTGGAFAEDGARLMVTAGEDWLRAWTVSSGQEASMPALEARDMLTGAVTTAFSADGSRLAAVSEGGTIGLWDLEDGQLQWSVQLRQLPSLSKESTAAEEDRQAPLGTPEPGAPVPGARPERATVVVGTLALDGDGSVLAVAVELRQGGQAELQAASTSESRILAWNVDAAEELPVVTLRERIAGLALNPEGNLATAATGVADVLLWDPYSRDEPLRLATGDRVEALVFSPDGARLATSTRSETRIWDVSNREGKSVTLPSVGGVWDLAFSPDGGYLVVAARDGGLKLYPLDIEVLLEEACSMVTRNLTQAEWQTNRRAVEFPQICRQQPLHDTVILALVREGRVQQARDDVARAGRRSLAVGYELGITPRDAIGHAYYTWAEQLVAARDFDGAVEKLALARQEVAGLPLERRAEAASVALAVCRQVAQVGPSDLVSAACEGIATLAREIGVSETVTSTVDSEAGDVWAVAGEEGQWLTIAMDRVDPDLDPYLNLYAPDGQWLASDDDGGGGWNALIFAFHLPQDGTYLVNADGWGDGQGGYTLSLRQMVPQAITLGVPVEDQIENGTLWTFEGEAGQMVRIVMAGNRDLRDPLIDVRGPDGMLLDWAANDEGNNVSLPRLVLPTDGTYTVVPDAATSLGGYTLTVVELVPQPITLGVPLEDQIENGTLWTFEGEAGQMVRIAMAGTSDLSSPVIDLHDPDGMLLDSADNHEGNNVSLSLLALPADGMYTVMPDAATSSGGYTLTVVELVPQPITMGVPLEDQIENGTLWTFEGEAGQMVRIAMAGTSDLSSPVIHLYDPDGMLLDSAANDEGNNVSLSLLALPADGMYTVMPDAATSSGRYTLTVAELVPQPIAPGRPVQGEIQAGTVWAFQGEAGQLVRIALEGRGDLRGPSMELRDPLWGLVRRVGSEEGSSALIPYLALPRDGRYVLILSSAQPGAYTLALTVPSTQMLRFGEPVTSDTAEGPVWTLAGEKGQVVWIVMRAGSSDFDPYLVLLAPDGVRLASDDDSGGDRDARIVAALPRDGVYRVLAEGSGRQRGPYELTAGVDIVDESEATQLLAESLLTWAWGLLEGGRVEAAVAAYEEADAWVDLSAYDWNHLCWSGSIEGFAAQVLPACEKAVALEPGNASYRDSRGLARALTGDSAGAIEDFRFYVDRKRDPARVAQRRAWIAALEAGQNPFDAATLWALRSQ